MTNFNLITEIMNIIADVNPVEIASQIEKDNLSVWCDRIKESVASVLKSDLDFEKARLQSEMFISKERECSKGCVD